MTTSIPDVPVPPGRLRRRRRGRRPDPLLPPDRLMTITDPTVDDLAELCAALAREEACEIMEEIKPRDLTACEIVALLTILRPARERVRLAQRQPAPVLTLVPRHIQEGA